MFVQMAGGGGTMKMQIRLEVQHHRPLIQSNSTSVISKSQTSAQPQRYCM